MARDELILSKLEDIGEELRDTRAKIETIETRLFRGNGRPSIQEQMTAHGAELSALRSDVDRLSRRASRRRAAPEKRPKTRNAIAAVLVAALGSGGVASFIIDKLAPSSSESIHATPIAGASRETRPGDQILD